MRKLLQILCCIGLCALPLEMIPASVSAETAGDGAEFIENVELLRGDSCLLYTSIVFLKTAVWSGKTIPFWR